MDKPTIVNYIDINGEDVLFESISEDQRKKAVEVIQDRIMHAVGYRRKTA